MPFAAVVPAPGQPVVVREFPLPELEPGSVLMRTRFSEVCGTDVYLQQGKLEGVPYPLIPGHVSVGEVVDVRAAVRTVDDQPVAVGDLITFLDVHQTCHHCWYCLVAKASTRCPKRKVYGITYGANEGLLGGWSQYVYLKPGVKIIKLPAGLAPGNVIAAGCALPTAIHAIDRAEIRLGDTVVVQGSGPVGLNAAMLARLSGAHRVIVIDQHLNRLDMARAFAADETVLLDVSNPHDAVARVGALTDGRGADVTIEATGAPAAVPQGMRMTRDGGKYVIVGHYTDHGEISINPHSDVNRRHLEVRGCWGSDFSHFFRMVRLLARHAHPPRWSCGWEPLVSATYRLEETNEALAAVASGKIVKAIIRPNET